MGMCLNGVAADRLQGAIGELQAVLGSRVTTAEAVRNYHSRGEGYYSAAAPDAVCFPRSTEEVSEVMGISSKWQIPIIPFGAGGAWQ